MAKETSCFSLLRSVDVSTMSHFSVASGTYEAFTEVMPATFSVRWPNGTPCGLVEAYLVHRYREGATVREVDGGSLRAMASKLSHLVRFCWNADRDFWELDDDTYFEFVNQLSKSRRFNAPLVPSRDGNTVRAISSECVTFLRWLQDTLCFRHDLIGYGSEYRIRLKVIERQSEKGRRHRGSDSDSGTFHRLPPVDTHEPKRPMPTAHRNRLWDAVSAMTRSKGKREPWCKTMQDANLSTSFLKSRRELLLYLLEATGARPGELARLSVLANADCYKTKKLHISTLKCVFRAIADTVPL